MARSTDPDTAFAQARKYIRGGKHAKAIALLTALSRHGYDQPKVLETLAVAHSMSGEYEVAVDSLEAAIVQSPDRTSAYVNLGAVYNRLGQYDRAIDRLNQAIRIDWRCVEAYYNLGISYRRMKDYGQAKAMFQEAIRLRPDMLDAWHNLATVFLETSNAPMAASWFRKVLKQKPDHAKAKKGLRAAEARLQELDRSPERSAGDGHGPPATDKAEPSQVPVSRPLKTLSYQDRITIRSCGMEIEQATGRLLEWFLTDGESLLQGLRRQLSSGIKRNKATFQFCDEMRSGSEAESVMAAKLEQAVVKLDDYQNRYLQDG